MALPPCRPAALPPCYPAAPPPCRPAALLPCHPAALQVRGLARAEVVTALCSTGVATARLDNGVSTEDTITLAVQWRNRVGGAGVGHVIAA